MTGPAVHFNIGVCAYRARSMVARRSRLFARSRARRRWQRSRITTSGSSRSATASRTKQRTGLRWRSAKRATNAASRWRRRSSRELPPPPERNWLAYGSLAAGYDDNVALVSGGDVLGVSGTDDTFAELQLAAAAPLVGAWRFDGGARAARLPGSGQLRPAEHRRRRALSRAARRLDWRSGLLQLVYATLDSEGFESKRMLILQATRR